MKKISLYQAMIIMLSLLVVVMTLLQLTVTLSPEVNDWFNKLDILIWLFFFIDYVVRLMKSNEKKNFILTHKVDLLVIIPFFSFYRIFRLIRVAKIVPLLRFTKVVKATIMLSTFSKQVGKFIRMNNLHYVAFTTIIIVLLGAGGISLVEGIAFKDALWWSIVTLTTVGYGDLVPRTGVGRFIASLLMLSGIGFLGVLTGAISTYFLNRRHVGYRPLIVEEMIKKLNHFDDLSFEEFQQIISILTFIKKNQDGSTENHENNLITNEERYDMIRKDKGGKEDDSTEDYSN